MWLQKRYLRLLMVAIGSTLLVIPGIVFAVPADHVLITEIQTGTISSASEEFIEIYNPTSNAIDISEWRIQYTSAASTDWSNPSRNISLNGVLPPRQHLLLASTDYLSDKAQVIFSAGLSKTGGHLRLVSPDAVQSNILITHDQVAWGKSLMPETTSAESIPDDQLLTRYIDEQNDYIDTNNNAEDLGLSNEPTPESTDPEVLSDYESVLPIGGEDPSIPESNTSAESEDLQSQQEEAESLVSNTGLLPPIITELLPNPAPPATDADDEFVELFNPNDQALNLESYVLQTGSTYSHKYTFTDKVLSPLSYTVFYVNETKAVLSNTAGQARLLDPTGQTVSETGAYTDAPSGSSWVLIGSTWQWTITPTPNLANGLAVPPISGSALISSKKTKAKKSTKAATKKVPKSSSASKKTAASKGGADSAVQKIAEDLPVHPTILAGVALLALGYAIYEYRGDMANRLHQLKRYRATRRATRPQPQG